MMERFNFGDSLGSKLLVLTFGALLFAGSAACNGDGGDDDDNGNGNPTDTGTPDTIDDLGTEDDGGGTGGTAQLQLFHNSADPAAAEVDIYARLGDSPTLVADNLGFRQATPHITVPAGTPWDAIIAVGSASDDDTLEESEIVAQVEDVSLTEDTANLAIANGLVDPSGFEGNQQISIDLKTDIRTTPQGDGADIQLFHGSTDAPANVDVAPANALGDSPVADDLAYGDFSGYVTLSGVNVLDLGTSDGTWVTNVQTPDLSSSTLGGVLTAVASGFLTTGGDDPDSNGFRIVAFPNNPSATGTVSTADFPLTGDDFVDGQPLPGAARAQLIHASSAGPFETVNIEAAGDTVASGLEFTQATGFLSVPVGTDIPVTVSAAGSSESFSQTLNISGESGGAVSTNVVFARGGTDGQDPGLTPIAARESTPVAPAAADGNIAFNAFHGATGAPSPVQVSVRAGGNDLVGPAPLEYNNGLGINEVVANTDAIVRLTGGGNDFDFALTPLENFTLSGTYATFYAVNTDGAPATVYAATEDGVTAELSLQQ